MTITTAPVTSDTVSDAAADQLAVDDKVLIGLNHGPADAEDVLIAYLMGVEALRAGKQALMFLTKDAVEVAVAGAAAKIDVPGAPAIADLHEEYVTTGGRFYVCPVCVKLRGLTDAEWAEGAEVKGAPSVYEFTAGGALVLNY